MRKTKWFLSLALSGLLAGCGELTSGGVGEAETHFTADEPDSPPPAASVAGGGWDRGPTPSAVGSASAVDGVLAARVQTFLRSDETGEWVEITDGPREITLDLSGQSERRAGARFVSDGSYSRFRVVFHRVEVDVTGGLVVDGVPLLGDVTVDLGAGGTLTVEREVDVEVMAEGRVEVLTNLNVDVWLPTVSLVTRTVTAAALEGAIEVRVR